MLCSLCGLFMLCFLRGLSVWNPAHLESAHFFAWVRSRSFADTNSLSRVFALPKKSGAIQPQSDVCHSRGYHVVGRQLLIVSGAVSALHQSLAALCSADLGDSAPPFVALISAR
jgi:hypothetical protein